jgi:predicted N-acyltransferase
VTADAMRVAVRASIEDVDRAQWSAVVAAAQAPVFYDYVFLRAYERAPLQQTEAFFYLLFADPAVAVLPVYVQSTDDPLGIVSGLGLPGRSPGDLILLTHVAHCYDTLLPARPGALTPRLVEQACAALARLAAQAGLKWFAFMNVDGAGELAGLLLSAGLMKIPMNTRYNKRITGYSSVEEFVAGIPSKKARSALRRSHRQGLQANMRIAHPDPASGVPETIGLCRRTTMRHGTAGYYPQSFGEFVAHAAEVISVTEVRLGDRLATASVCLHDPVRFHLWAGGIDYSVAEGIHNAFPLMLLPAVAEAIDARRPVFEAGRGNGGVKESYRTEPVPLFAFVAAT